MGGVRREGRRLKLTPSKTGHLLVTIYSQDVEQWRVGVHHIVALAFHGPAPEGKPFACHKNGWPAENYPSNLYWGSRADNAADMVRHMTQRGPSMELLRSVRRRKRQAVEKIEKEAARAPLW
jgi:hypothetical protein